MSMPVLRTCLLCEHFNLVTAERDWSEVTPGAEFTMYCGQRVWDFNSYADTEETFRAKMETAATCKHFRHYKRGTI